MKAIYINLDPYLAAFAAWLKGGRSGPAPSDPSIPLAVTIPLGESAVLYVPHDPDGLEESYNEVTINGQTVEFSGPDPTGTEIATKIVPGLSALAPSAKYYAIPVTGDTSLTVYFDNSGLEVGLPIVFTVLVRREQASGPIDIVDFTPPAAAIAAGTDLKGTKFDGNEIVAAAGTGALSAPAGA